jgi:hypothetical protein
VEGGRRKVEPCKVEPCKVEGARRKVEGGRRKAPHLVTVGHRDWNPEGGRQKVEGGRWKVEGGRWKMVDSEKWTVEKADSRRWKVEGGRWMCKVEGGRAEVEGGARKAPKRHVVTHRRASGLVWRLWRPKIRDNRWILRMDHHSAYTTNLPWPGEHPVRLFWPWRYACVSSVTSVGMPGRPRPRRMPCGGSGD